MEALGLSLADINNSTPEQIHSLIRGMNIAGADSIFVAATNFRAIDVIAAVEAETGLPVITSNQAAIWKGLDLLGIRGGRPGFGRLLQA
jgi:maleate isomerase